MGMFHHVETHGRASLQSCVSTIDGRAFRQLCVFTTDARRNRRDTRPCVSTFVRQHYQINGKI